MTPFEVQPTLVQVSRRAEEIRTPGERLNGVRRVVVIRHDRLGDFLLTLPAIDALQRTYPEAEITVMVSAAVRPIAERVPIVDRVVEVSSDAGGVRERLREIGADLVIAASRGAPFAWAVARAGVRHRVGTGHRFYSALFERRVDEHRSEGLRHEVEYTLSYAHRAGATAGPARFPLQIGDADLELAEAWIVGNGLPGVKFVVIHAGSGGSCPRWPVEHFLDLGDRLRQSGIDVVFTVGPGDAEVEARLQDRPERSRAPIYRGALPGLAALVSRAGLVVGSSTGPVHLAAALERPTLALHAPWPTCGATRWGPYDSRGWAIVAEAPGISSWRHTRRRELASRLMAGIPPEFVFETALQLYEGRSPA